MSRLLIAIITAAALCTSLFANADANPAEIKKLAETLAEATVKGNSGKVLDHTFDRVVQMLGGREKGVSTMNSAIRRMKQSGFTIAGYKIGDPGPIQTEGKYSFTVVPATIEMKTTNARLVTKSYILGISSDSGKTWKFVDGAGLKNVEMRSRVLPKLPEGFTLPEIPMPEILPGT